MFSKKTRQVISVILAWVYMLTSYGLGVVVTTTGCSNKKDDPVNVVVKVTAPTITQDALPTQIPTNQDVSFKIIATPTTTAKPYTVSMSASYTTTQGNANDGGRSVNNGYIRINNDQKDFIDSSPVTYNYPEMTAKKDFDITLKALRNGRLQFKIDASCGNEIVKIEKLIEIKSNTINIVISDPVITTASHPFTVSLNVNQTPLQSDVKSLKYIASYASLFPTDDTNNPPQITQTFTFDPFKKISDISTYYISIPRAGDISLYVEVIDDQDNKHSATRVVTIPNTYAPDFAFEAMIHNTTNKYVEGTEYFTGTQFNFALSNITDLDGYVTQLRYRIMKSGVVDPVIDWTPIENNAFNVAFQDAGNYSVIMRAVDNGGKEKTITAPFIIKSSVGPVGIINIEDMLSQYIAGNTININASGSSAQSGSSIAQYEWSLVYPDNTERLLGTGVRIISNQLNYIGTGKIKLVITDNLNRSSITYKDVVVVNREPSLIMKKGGVNGIVINTGAVVNTYVRETLTLTAVASDPDATIYKNDTPIDSLSYFWDIGLGNGYQSSPNNYLEFTPMEPNTTRTIKCKIVDMYGGTKEQIITVAVLDKPVINADFEIQTQSGNGPANYRADDKFTFRSISSPTDGASLVAQEWTIRFYDKNDNEIVEYMQDGITGGLVSNYILPHIGKVKVELFIRDSLSNESRKEEFIDIGSYTPVIEDGSFSITPESGSTPLTVTINATVIDPDLAIKDMNDENLDSLRIDIYDGTTKLNETPFTSFPIQQVLSGTGKKNVKVRVTDNYEKYIDSQSYEITVLAEKPASAIISTKLYDNLTSLTLNQTNGILLRGTESNGRNDAVITNYKWSLTRTVNNVTTTVVIKAGDVTNAGEFRYKPDFIGEGIISLEITDANNAVASTSGAGNAIVRVINTQPTATNVSVNATQVSDNGKVTLTINNAADPDTNGFGDELVYEFKTNEDTTWISKTNNNHEFTLTNTSYDQDKDYYLYARIKDKHNGTWTSQAIAVKVLKRGAMVVSLNALNLPNNIYRKDQLQIQSNVTLSSGATTITKYRVSVKGQDEANFTTLAENLNYNQSAIPLTLYTCNKVGQMTFELYVEDSMGQTMTIESALFAVQNRKPEAFFTINGETANNNTIEVPLPRSGYTPHLIQLDASGSVDHDEDAITYYWYVYPIGSSSSNVVPINGKTYSFNPTVSMQSTPHIIELRVTDQYTGLNIANFKTQTIQAKNTNPAITELTMTDGTTTSNITSGSGPTFIIDKTYNFTVNVLTDPEITAGYQNATYTWYVNDTVSVNFTNNTFSFTPTNLGTQYTIKVRVSDGFSSHEKIYSKTTTNNQPSINIGKYEYDYATNKYSDQITSFPGSNYTLTAYTPIKIKIDITDPDGHDLKREGTMLYIKSNGTAIATLDLFTETQHSSPITKTFAFDPSEANYPFKHAKNGGTDITYTIEVIARDVRGSERTISIPMKVTSAVPGYEFYYIQNGINYDTNNDGYIDAGVDMTTFVSSLRALTSNLELPIKENTLLIVKVNDLDNSSTIKRQLLETVLRLSGREPNITRTTLQSRPLYFNDYFVMNVANISVTDNDKLLTLAASINDRTNLSTDTAYYQNGSINFKFRNNVPVLKNVTITGQKMKIGGIEYDVGDNNSNIVVTLYERNEQGVVTEIDNVMNKIELTLGYTYTINFEAIDPDGHVVSYKGVVVEPNTTSSTLLSWNTSNRYFDLPVATKHTHFSNSYSKIELRYGDQYTGENGSIPKSYEFTTRNAAPVISRIDYSYTVTNSKQGATLVSGYLYAKDKIIKYPVPEIPRDVSLNLTFHAYDVDGAIKDYVYVINNSTNTPITGSSGTQSTTTLVVGLTDNYANGDYAFELSVKDGFDKPSGNINAGFKVVNAAPIIEKVKITQNDKEQEITLINNTVPENSYVSLVPDQPFAVTITGYDPDSTTEIRSYTVDNITGNIGSTDSMELLKNAPGYIAPVIGTHHKLHATITGNRNLSTKKTIDVRVANTAPEIKVLYKIGAAPINDIDMIEYNTTDTLTMTAGQKIYYKVKIKDVDRQLVSVVRNTTDSFGSIAATDWTNPADEKTLPAGPAKEVSYTIGSNKTDTFTATDSYLASSSVTVKYSVINNAPELASMDVVYKGETSVKTGTDVANNANFTYLHTGTDTGTLKFKPNFTDDENHTVTVTSFTYNGDVVTPVDGYYSIPATSSNISSKPMIIKFSDGYAEITRSYMINIIATPPVITVNTDSAIKAGTSHVLGVDYTLKYTVNENDNQNGSDFYEWLTEIKYTGTLSKTLLYSSAPKTTQITISEPIYYTGTGAQTITITAKNNVNSNNTAALTLNNTVTNANPSMVSTIEYAFIGANTFATMTEAQFNALQWNSSDYNFWLTGNRALSNVILRYSFTDADIGSGQNIVGTLVSNNTKIATSGIVQKSFKTGSTQWVYITGLTASGLEENIQLTAGTNVVNGSWSQSQVGTILKSVNIQDPAPVFGQDLVLLKKNGMAWDVVTTITTGYEHRILFTVTDEGSASLAITQGSTSLQTMQHNGVTYYYATITPNGNVNGNVNRSIDFSAYDGKNTVTKSYPYTETNNPPIIVLFDPANSNSAIKVSYFDATGIENTKSYTTLYDIDAADLIGDGVVNSTRKFKISVKLADPDGHSISNVEGNTKIVINGIPLTARSFDNNILTYEVSADAIRQLGSLDGRSITVTAQDQYTAGLLYNSTQIKVTNTPAEFVTLKSEVDTEGISIDPNDDGIVLVYFVNNKEYTIPRESGKYSILPNIPVKIRAKIKDSANNLTFKPIRVSAANTESDILSSQTIGFSENLPQGVLRVFDTLLLNPVFGQSANFGKIKFVLTEQFSAPAANRELVITRDVVEATNQIPTVEVAFE